MRLAVVAAIALSLAGLAIFGEPTRSGATEARSVSGVIYFDRNLNGERDVDEIGALGRAVEVQDSAEGTVRRARSGEDGRYEVTGLSSERAYLIYVVTDEQTPCGDTSMRRLEPDADWSQIDLALIEGDREISGAVVDDANENGLRDAGETGREGWTVVLGGSEAVMGGSCVVYTVSGTDGEFRFRGLPEGSYWLDTGAPDESAGMMWELTYHTVPNPAYPQFAMPALGIVLSGDVRSVQRDLGVHALSGTGTIALSTFIDTNTNEVRDPGEPLAECWQSEGIHLYRSVPGIGLLYVTGGDTSCADGVSSVTGLPDGTYGLWFPFWCTTPEQQGPPSNPDKPTAAIAELEGGGRILVEHGKCPWGWVEVSTPTPSAAPASTMPTGVVAAPVVGEGTAEAGRADGWRTTVTLAILGAAVCGGAVLRRRRRFRNA